MNGYRVQTLNTTISLYWHWLFLLKKKKIKWQIFFYDNKASFDLIWDGFQLTSFFLKVNRKPPLKKP